MEDLKEGSMGSGGSLSTTEFQVLADVLDVLEIHHELLRPLCGTLSNSDHYAVRVS